MSTAKFPIKCYWGQLYMLYAAGHITATQLDNMTKEGQLQLDLTKFEKPTGLPDELSDETKEVVCQLKWVRNYSKEGK